MLLFSYCDKYLLLFSVYTMSDTLLFTLSLLIFKIILQYTIMFFLPIVAEKKSRSLLL